MLALRLTGGNELASWIAQLYAPEVAPANCAAAFQIGHGNKIKSEDLDVRGATRNRALGSDGSDRELTWTRNSDASRKVPSIGCRSN
jgi:hypothetical protein